MSEYFAGNYTAKIVDYGFRTTNSGNIMIAVLFKYDQQGQEKKLTWFGSLNEGKAREITLDTLDKMGFQGEGFVSLADGISSGLLDTDKDYSIVVAMEEYQGKTSARINWVNLPGEGGTIKEKLAKADVIQKLQGMNLKADLIQRFANRRPQQQQTPQPPQPPQPQYQQNISQPNPPPQTNPSVNYSANDILF